MLWGTHICLPVGAALILENRSLAKGNGYVFPPWSLPIAALCGVLPDILSPHISLDDRFHSWSHSVWFLAGMIPLCFMGAFMLPKGDLPRWRAAVLWWLAAMLHVAADAISGGVALLYPWKQEVTGRYFIPPGQWLWWDAGLILVTYVLFRLRPRAVEKGMKRSIREIQ